MLRFKVDGVDKDTGQEISQIISADTETSAVRLANQNHNMAVSAIKQIHDIERRVLPGGQQRPAGEPPAPPPKPPNIAEPLPGGFVAGVFDAFGGISIFVAIIALLGAFGQIRAHDSNPDNNPAPFFMTAGASLINAVLCFAASAVITLLRIIAYNTKPKNNA